MKTPPHGDQKGSLKSPIQQTAQANEEFQKHLDRIKDRVAVLRKGKSEGDETKEADVASRQDFQQTHAHISDEKRVVEDLTSLALSKKASEKKPDEHQYSQVSLDCPVCSGSLLRNHNPNDDQNNKSPLVYFCSAIEDASQNAACSLSLPMHELFESIVAGKGEDNSFVDSAHEREQLIQKTENWYCTTCKAYIVKDEKLIEKAVSEKERAIQELECLRRSQIKEVELEFKREMEELDAQYKQQISNMEANHTKQVIEMKYEKSEMQADHCQRLSEMEHKHEVLSNIKEEQEKKIEALFSKVYKGEQLRRKLHNHLQELRGSVRVFVRTRPFISLDCRQMNEPSPITVSHDHENLSILDQRTTKRHDFRFDRVFSSSTEQDGVFEEVSDFVQSALDGYDVCLFAYGQTGSGKTYTMQGCGDGALRGIIPRTLEEILAQAKSLESDKFEYKMKASFLEIYNEELIDLLTKKRDPKTTKLAIKRNERGKSFVENLTKISIDSTNPENAMRQLKVLMKRATHTRSAASTNMSEHSSRSHAVFILDLEGFNKETGAHLRGSLNLCDLAGSERLKRTGTGASKERLLETQAINKSLSSLGVVFNALAKKAPHVPYRNSKLTYLLQDCLSGDGKALMLVNLSPTLMSGGESLCSLRFAQQVNQVSFGKVTRNIEYTKK